MEILYVKLKMCFMSSLPCLACFVQIYPQYLISYEKNSLVYYVGLRQCIKDVFMVSLCVCYMP